MRGVVAAWFVVAACGRSQGVPDKDLGGLVVAPTTGGAIDVDRATKDPDALGAALALPEHAIAKAIGPHVTTIVMATHVTENGKPVTDLDDTTTIELGDAGAFHAVYSNSADYGREVAFTGGTLYLRPRYQRWHGRAPETPDEAEQILDSFADPVFATWDLVAPGVELTDRGAAQVAGRTGRKIEIKPAGARKKPAPEPLVQRKWRETRTIDGLTGEVVLDADKGVVLALKLSGTIGFVRDGRHFAMQVSVQCDVSKIGEAVAIQVPAAEDVVATPERLREVDDRDFLLQGIAPPLRKNTDGTAVAPAPKPAPKETPNKSPEKK
jgi:hypothetical protein